jgi:hypothetical protein
MDGMRMMLLSVAGLFAASQPAFAQKDDLAGIDAAYNAPARPCLDAHKDTTIQPQARLAACANGLASLDAIFNGRPSPGAHEVNIYHFVRGFLSLEIGGAYVKIDAVRSARVCTQTEAAWAELAKISDSASPAGYQKNFGDMRSGIKGAVAKCRGEFGAPAGATALP